MWRSNVLVGQVRAWRLACDLAPAVSAHMDNGHLLPVAAQLVLKVC